MRARLSPNAGSFPFVLLHSDANTSTYVCASHPNTHTQCDKGTREKTQLTILCLVSFFRPSCHNSQRYFSFFFLLPTPDLRSRWVRRRARERRIGGRGGEDGVKEEEDTHTRLYAPPLFSPQTHTHTNTCTTIQLHPPPPHFGMTTSRNVSSGRARGWKTAAAAGLLSPSPPPPSPPSPLSSQEEANAGAREKDLFSSSSSSSPISGWTRVRKRTTNFVPDQSVEHV